MVKPTDDFDGKDTNIFGNSDEIGENNLENNDIQKDKDSNIMWSSITPERAHRYIYEETGLERAEGDMLVRAQADAAKKALDKANKALEKHKNTKTTNIPKYIKDKAVLQQQIDDAQRVVDYWNNVKSINQIFLLFRIVVISDGPIPFALKSNIDSTSHLYVPFA